MMLAHPLTLLGLWTQVAGTRIYDETKVAAFAAVVTSVLLLLSGVAAAWPFLQLFWLGMVMPGAAAAAWARSAFLTKS